MRLRNSIHAEILAFGMIGPTGKLGAPGSRAIALGGPRGAATLLAMRTRGAGESIGGLGGLAMLMVGFVGLVRFGSGSGSTLVQNVGLTNQQLTPQHFQTVVEVVLPLSLLEQVGVPMPVQA